MKKSRFTEEQLVFILKQVDLNLDKALLQDVWKDR
ncbi:hypothetical protein AI2618V1_1067 [Serratia marcescens]|nr:hypothetical protein AI2618V1_1067 [Serratia marcescens]CAE7285100.1 hypothetical protein AI2617V1_1058 [Serratia marcescens]CAH3557439.1 hypothetical protein AI2618V1_1067 [Serratia marcescens]CAH3879810.1 hypothetical protein AI2617V1_1058 [Serratia marcescens]CAI1540225.1 Uncharacterised protein [Serratia marcescens]